MQQDVFDRFIEAVAHGDRAALARTLSQDVRLRALIPQGLREAEGPEAVAERFLGWFGGYGSELVAGSREAFGGRVRLIYRLRLTKEGAVWDLEQHAFCDADGDAIHRIDLVCSGFRPVVEHDGNGTYRYDAGTMSCNDGLDEQFKQAIGSIPVGGAMQVRAHDASAKVELPSFARLLGHEVRSIEEPSGGGVLVTVERRR